jgi:hypothetical protein
MPITVTFDLSSETDDNDRARIRLAFKRLGWETIGGTAYRYPPLEEDPDEASSREDWFNHVVPALMYMRSLIDERDIEVSNFTIDAFSSTGWRSGSGPEIQSADEVNIEEVETSDRDILSEQRLRDWLRSCRDET